MDAEVHVQISGHVFRTVPSLIKTSCDIDVTLFPTDEQACDFEVNFKILCNIKFMQN